MAKMLTTQPTKTLQFYYSLLVGLSGMVIGTTAGWNSASNRLMADGQPNEDQWQSMGVYCLGAAFGGLTHGHLARFFGYRLTVGLCDLFASIGWLMFAFIDSLEFERQERLAIGRFVQGLAAGGLGILMPTYITHIANVELRGRMQMVHQAFIIFGVLFSYAFGSNTTYAMMTGVCAAWSLFHILVTFIFMPESPYYMYRLRYRRKVVEKMMRYVDGQNYVENSDYDNVQEYMVMVGKKSSPGKRGQEQSTWIVGVGLIAFQQLCGANVLTFYAIEIFNEFFAADVPTANAQRLAIAMLITQLLLCIVALEAMELLGRKFMLILSAVGMCSCLFALAAFHRLAARYGDDGLDNTVPVTLVFLYAGFYSVGWGTVVTVVYSEIMLFDKRFSNWIYAAGQCLMLITAHTFFDAGHLAGNAYALCAYATVCGLSVPFVSRYVPETRALPQSWIQSVLLGRGKRAKSD